MKRSAVLLVLAVGALACSSTQGTGSGGGTATGGGGPGPGSGGGNPDGGGSPTATVGSGGQGHGGGTLDGTVDHDTTFGGNVTLASTTTVPAGVTLVLEPGTDVRAAPGASLIVAGKLRAVGLATAPIVFESTSESGPGDWGGLVAASGGLVTVTHAAIRFATMGLTAQPGSSYALDYIAMDTSKALLNLQANGTVGHGLFHALGANQSGFPVTIEAASPHFSDTSIDNSNQNNDHIGVSGTSSSPTFDHMELTGAHCGVHFNDGMNITVSNSSFHDLQYGAMIYGALATSFTGCNFINNAINVGECTSGDVTLTDDYLDDAPFDAKCNGQANDQPSAIPNTDVGPRP